MEGMVVKFTPGKPWRGWLRRQGGMMRGWQRRFFVLKDNCLFCFAKQDDTRIPHIYFLHDYQLGESSSSTDDSDKFAFELISEKGSGESVTLCAASDEDRKEWIRGLRYHMYADRGGAIFSFTLEETIKYEHKQGRSLPYIVEACVQHLDTYAMQTEGIFRLAGRAGLVKELREQFETGRKPALTNVDVHTVGSLLKAYLRDLPESLVPPDLYQRAMNFAIRYSEANSDEVRKTELTGLSKLLDELPDANYAALAYICRFLHRLAANANITKMNAHNLSLVFGPNLIRHLDDNPQLLMLTADLTQHFAYMLIHHCPDVLPLKPDRESVPSRPAANSPVLRKKNPACDKLIVNDLLRLSTPVDSSDPSLLVPQPTRLGKLMQPDFSTQPSDACDNDQSASPSSSFVFVSSHFGASSQSASEKGDGSTSSEASGTAEGTETGSTSSPGLERRPVVPLRAKARTMRSRRSARYMQSPVGPDVLSCQKGSKDDLVLQRNPDKPLVHISQSVREKNVNLERTHTKESYERKAPELSDTVSELPTSQFYRSLKLDTHSDREKKPSSSDVSSMLYTGSNTGDLNSSATEDECSAGSVTNTSKLGPSRTMLEAQVTGLKSELMHVKMQAERHVSALKGQLTDIRSKYETRIDSLEKQQGSQILDLKAKLNAEHTARSEAVERSVSLQTLLYKYQLQYGQLQD